MIEVEIKIEVDIREVEKRLEDSGATLGERVEQSDTYYSAPHRDFAYTDEAVRIRREKHQDIMGDGRTEEIANLNYKGPKIDTETKSREEFEVGIDDSGEMDAILTALGFEEFETVVKKRKKYEFRGCEVLLDEVEEVGSFVEVEKEADTEGFEEVRDEVSEVVEFLGLDPEDSIRKSYLRLLIETKENDD